MDYEEREATAVIVCVIIILGLLMMGAVVYGIVRNLYYASCHWGKKLIAALLLLK